MNRNRWWLSLGIASLLAARLVGQEVPGPLEPIPLPQLEAVPSTSAGSGSSVSRPLDLGPSFPEPAAEASVVPVPAPGIADQRPSLPLATPQVVVPGSSWHAVPSTLFVTPGCNMHRTVIRPVSLVTVAPTVGVVAVPAPVAVQVPPRTVVYRARSHVAVVAGPDGLPLAVESVQLRPYFVPGQPVRNAWRRHMPW